ncbi:MAG: ketopantoate reductase family protein [Paracoccaceae bacterium]
MSSIVVIGSGAMGSIYAVLMADAGHDVSIVDIDQAHVDATNANGLRVEGASGDRTIRIPAQVDVDGMAPADHVIIATKYDGVADAARKALKVMRDDTDLVTVQNGLGSADIVADSGGGDRLSMGVVGGFQANLKGPGHSFHNGMEMVRFGSYANHDQARLERIANIWKSAGFDAQVFDDIHRMVWDKLLINCAVNGPCAITNLRTGPLLADPHGREISQRCISEAFAVAKAKGISLSTDDPIAYLQGYVERMPNGFPSTAQDHAARKKGEIDAINGAIVREGAPLGIETPMNGFVRTLIKARESAF